MLMGESQRFTGIETTRIEIELVEQNGYKTKQRERDKMVDLVAMAG
jgi:hypothetical protein